MVSPMETKLPVLLRAQGADQQEHPAHDGDVPHRADLEQESLQPQPLLSKGHLLEESRRQKVPDMHLYLWPGAKMIAGFHDNSHRTLRPSTVEGVEYQASSQDNILVSPSLHHLVEEDSTQEHI